MQRLFETVLRSHTNSSGRFVTDDIAKMKEGLYVSKEGKASVDSRDAAAATGGDSISYWALFRGAE